MAGPNSARRAGVLLLASLASGCGPKSPAAPPSKEPVIEATPTVITPHDDEAPEQMFERARGLLIMNRGADAARLFDRLAEQGGRLTPLARFNAGIGWEQAGDRATALLRFRTAAVLAPTGEAGKWARLRQARIEGYAEQWT
ncbi:MAG TPA: hypothetical protein VJT73_20880, partial [Polyangiaceae bacterium]|nr:hypothetical protein [Polyangiaceae bacterium]